MVQRSDIKHYLEYPIIGIQSDYQAESHECMKWIGMYTTVLRYLHYWILVFSGVGYRA